jgi:hypothetical protein
MGMTAQPELASRSTCVARASWARAGALSLGCSREGAVRLALDAPDETIELMTPRSRRDSRYIDYSEALLSALGVSAPQAESGVASTTRASVYPVVLERTA